MARASCASTSRDLTEENRKTVRPPKSRSTGPFATISPTGIADGSIRPCDPKLSAFAIAGSLNWIGHWYQRDGAWSAEAVASEFAVHLTEGLAQSDTAESGQPVTNQKKQAGEWRVAK